MTALSFVIPVRNAGPGLVRTIASVVAEASGFEHEIVIVDDGSTDTAVSDVRVAFPGAPLIVVPGAGAGAAAALNRGLAAARHQIVCQVDQDVVLRPGWLRRLLACLDAPDVAAVQGQYVTDPDAPLLARVMGRDLQDRYAAVGAETGHACTGNVIYRASALRDVGGFDESLGYGYDNDMSYRLRAAGYRLAYCASAHSTHAWRHGLVGYLRQQYGFGYGRLDLVAKHTDRLGGDSVSPAPMMLHPVVMGSALLCALAGLTRGDGNGPWWSVAALLVVLLVMERTVAGVRAAVRFRDWVPLLFPLVHLARDLAWVAAIATWTVRRFVGVRTRPWHSMRPRTAAATSSADLPTDDYPATGRRAHGERPALRAQPTTRAT